MELVSFLAEGPRPYAEMLGVQQAAAARVKAGGPEALLLLEHAPVVTVGRNASLSDLHASPERLAAIGIEVAPADRGGKLTFHGPGQLVAYPILDLARAPALPDVRRYVRTLEEVLAATAARFGVEAARSDVPARWSSVWVGNDKLAAIGVHISRWVTTHGVALNVSTDLSRFSLFVPCGITDGGVTSLARLLAPAPAPPVAEVADRFAEAFAAAFGRPLSPVPSAAFRASLGGPA